MVSGTPCQMGLQLGYATHKETQIIYGRIIKLLRISGYTEEVLDRIYSRMDPNHKMIKKKWRASPMARTYRCVLYTGHIRLRSSRNSAGRKCCATVCCVFSLACNQLQRAHSLWRNHKKQCTLPRSRIGLEYVFRSAKISFGRGISTLQGNAFVSFTYAGFLGVVTGMNSHGMGFGEKSYGNPGGETLDGIPCAFSQKSCCAKRAT